MKLLVIIAALLATGLAGCSPAPAEVPTVRSPAATAVVPTTPSSPVPTPARTTAPKPKPVKPALYFWGDYRVVSKMSKTTHPGYYRKSKTKKTSWTIFSTCNTKKCRSEVDTRYVSEDFTLTYTRGHWRGTSTYKLRCIDLKTGKRAGPDVRQSDTYDLRRTKAKGAVATRLEGTNHLRQLDACGGRERTTFQVVLTRR